MFDATLAKIIVNLISELYVDLSRGRSRQRLLFNASGAGCPSVCLSVCRQNAHKTAIFSKNKQFRAVVSVDLQKVLCGLFKEPIIGP